MRFLPLLLLSCLPVFGDCDDPLDPACRTNFTDINKHLFVVQGLPFSGSVGVRANPDPSMWLARGVDGHIHTWASWRGGTEICSNDCVFVVWPWQVAAVNNTNAFRTFKVIDADRGTNGIVTNWFRFASTTTNSNLQIYELTNLWSVGSSLIDTNSDLKPWEQLWFFLTPGAYTTNGDKVVFSPPVTNNVNATNFWPADINLVTNGCWYCVTNDGSGGVIDYTNGIAQTNQGMVNAISHTNVTGVVRERALSLLGDAKRPKLMVVGSSILVAAPELTRFRVETAVSVAGPWTNFIDTFNVGVSGTNAFPIDKTSPIRLYRLRYSSP